MHWSVFCFISFIGLTLISGGFFVMLNSPHAQHWATAPGEITRADLYIHDDGERATYQPDIDFIYSVGATSYSGHENWQDTRIRNRAQVEAFLDGYPVGKQVHLKYNPRRPADAVLARHNRWRLALFLMSMGVFSCIMSLLVALLAR